MVLGELSREVGSKYAAFRYAGIRISDRQISSVLYFALIKTQEIYEDSSLKKGTRVWIPYVASAEEDEAVLNHIRHFCYLQNMDVLDESTTTYLVKDIFEKEPGKMKDLPFEKTDVVREFVFFDNWTWLFFDDEKSEFSALEKDINSSLTTEFFNGFFKSLSPIMDSWISKGNVLLGDLKALAYNTDLLTHHPGLMPEAAHIRDINIYDNDKTYVIKIRGYGKNHDPKQYMIENYHGKKETRYLSYRVMNKNYLLRRLFHEINGKSIDKLESELIAVYQYDRLRDEILGGLSALGVLAIKYKYSDIELPEGRGDFCRMVLKHYKEMQQRSKGKIYRFEASDKSFCFIPHDRLEFYRKNGSLLSVDLSAESVLVINKELGKLSLMGRPGVITGLKKMFNDDWTVNKVDLKDIEIGDSESN